jgi:hypothetical protein
MNPERDDPAAEVRCRMWSDAGGGAEVAASVRSEWRWQAFPLFRCGRIEQPAWVWLTTEPVWDPQKGNYPPDLAIRVAYAALVGSAPASEPSGR